jgi:hypothetical protein
MKFEDLEFEADDMNGIRAFMLFDNNYGVSVIRNPYSYGGRDGLYELVVVHMSPDMSESKLDYDNPVANGDVRGHLTPEDVTQLMEEVVLLPVKN